MLSGVTSLGLATSVLPVRIAGASLRQSTASGKFQGQIAADDADRRAQQVDDLAAGLAGEDLALHAPVPLRGVAQQVLGEVDLATGLVGRLADLADEDLGELVAVGGDDVREHPQVGAARDRRGRGPRRLRGTRRGERVAHLRGARAWHLGEGLLGGGVDDRQRVAGGRAPAAADVERLADEMFEIHHPI